MSPASACQCSQQEGHQVRHPPSATSMLEGKDAWEESIRMMRRFGNREAVKGIIDGLNELSQQEGGCRRCQE